MNAWVLSMIMCAASPAADGSYCSATPLAFGLSQEVCRSELQRWSQHPSRPRLECVNDPQLSAALAEQEPGRKQPGLTPEAGHRRLTF